MKDKFLPFILSLLFFSVIFVSFVSAAPSGSSSTLVSKNGNAFTSSTGNYATATHCIPPTCSWISGNQAIVGVYDGNPTNWGGTLEYNFDLSRYVGIQKVDLIIEWPNSIGKGLHSPFSDGGGKIAFGSSSNVLFNFPLNVARCIPNNDYFAHSCSQFSITKNIPLSQIHANTKVYLIADDGTAWDVGKVKLRVTTNSGSRRCPAPLSCNPNGTPI